MEGAVNEKRRGTSGAEGVDYQLNLILTTWLRANKNYKDNFEILSEWESAGNFDDVVLKYKNNDVNHIRYLQAKHVIDEKKTITYNDLISNDKFIIEKYFKSFVNPKYFKVDKTEDLILFTNLALDADVLPFVDALPDDDPIFRFRQNKANGGTPSMHKLNKKFIAEYKYSKLRCIVKTFINCCIMGREVGKKDYLFIECQFILSTDIADVKEGKFNSNFINCKRLNEGTQQFRRILLEEWVTKELTCLSPDQQKDTIRYVPLIFPSGFGELPRNKKTKVWPIVTMTPEEEQQFITFCGLFKLATNQPNEKELISFIESECEDNGRKPHVRLATLHLKYAISEWYKNEKSPYPLNSKSLETRMGCIEKDKLGLKVINETERNVDELSPLKLQFENIPYEEDLKSFLQQSAKNVFHLNTRGFMKVSLLKLLSCLERLHQIDHLFCPIADISKFDKFSEVLRGSEIFKILVCEMPIGEISLELMRRVESLINEDKEKKLIFVTNFNKEEVEFNNYHSFRYIEDITLFKDLVEETQKTLSEREISFQGSDVPFNSIYGKEIPPNHQDIDSWGILIDKHIQMNKIFAKFDSSYYINRTLTADFPYFNRDTIQKELGDQHIITYKNNDFIEQIKQHPTKHVHLLFKSNDVWCRRVSKGGIKELSKFKKGSIHFEYADNTFCQGVGLYTFSDMAGYGKTTTTSYLANEIQKQHPNCWVTRLQPSHLKFGKEESLNWPEDDICKYVAFLMEKLFKLTSPLERFIFKQYLEDEESKSKLFFIFDGFDEIDEHYQKVIFRALDFLKMKRNVKFIGIGTRPQYQEQLEEGLQAVAYNLRPFSHENKITFLEKFWESRKVNGHNDRLRDYSKRLIRLISESISDKELNLTGIPLQMRMIGEIYEEGAINYLAGDLEEDAIVAVDLFGLYEQFIKKKEDVYFNDKLCLISSTSQKSIILKPFRKIQTEFAIKVILGGDYGDLKDQLKDSIGFGIIQENQGRYRFIHRTFAEFLTAKYILDYTQSVSTTFYIDHLMQVMYQSNCEVVRKFINSKLDYKEMASKLKKPEYKEKMHYISRDEFEYTVFDYLETGTFEVLYLQLDLYSYWYPEDMKELLFIEYENGDEGGLLLEACYFDKLSLCVHHMAKVWLTCDHNASLLLLHMLEYVIKYILFSTYEIDKLTAQIVTDLQDELEEKQILSEECLKSILISEDYMGFMKSFTGTLGYLKHLKLKHEQLFYLFFRDDNESLQSLLIYGNYVKFYELFGEKEDPNLVFSTFVVSAFTDFKSSNKIDLESHLKLISKYIRHFDPQKLEEFKTYLLEYILDHGWYYTNKVDSQGHSLLEFLRNHRDIIDLEEFMQNIKIHKNISFIENCALWRWNEDLKYILDAGDIEIEKVDRLQLERCESLDEKIKCILKSIRVHNTDEQLMEIARVTHHHYDVRVTLNVTFYSKAILYKDEFRTEIYSSWITSDELFDAFMAGTPVTQRSVKFVIKRFPLYKMRFFEINKNHFVTSLIPSILKDEKILNKEEFLRLNQLQNDDGETILFNICNRWNRKEKLYNYEIQNPLRFWLYLMEIKCTTDDIVRLFRTKNRENKTVFVILNNKSIYSCGQQKESKKLIYLFLEKMKLVELMKEIDIKEEGFHEEKSSNKEESADRAEISEDKKADGEGFSMNEGEEIFQGEKRNPDIGMDEGHIDMKKSN